MGMKKDGASKKDNFNPNDHLTRAEFATVFSRLIYGDTNNVPLNSSSVRYSKHMQALKRDGIMTNISQPYVFETR